MIVGVGIDLVEIDRLRESLRRFGERFETRIFTPAERAYCHSQSSNCDLSFAGRFAAKEAFVKALGIGVAQGISWQDISIEHGPSGRAQLRVTGRARDLADAAGARRAHVSISHTGAHAIAVVVLEN